MTEIKTVRIGNKLVIADGKNPIMYVDLTKRKLVKYREPLKFKLLARLKEKRRG